MVDVQKPEDQANFEISPETVKPYPKAKLDLKI